MVEFVHLSFKRTFNVKKIITVFYKEFSKDFYYEAESHDFWEMVYIDKGEMVCTADKKQFVLKGGELTFHKPGEYHNISSNRQVAPNMSVVTFVCKSRAMKYFENRIIRLNSEEKGFLSMIISEGLSAFELFNDTPPIWGMRERKNAPLGSSQMTKNLLEVFLIKLCRNGNAVSKASRQSTLKDGINISYEVRLILDFMQRSVGEKICLDDIARAVSKSPSSVKAAFAQFYNGGIMNYFNMLKIKEAKRLIREKNMNFTQIAQNLSFDNVHYFSKCFKHFTNMTPSEYKNSII